MDIKELRKKVLNSGMLGIGRNTITRRIWLYRPHWRRQSCWRYSSGKTRGKWRQSKTIREVAGGSKRRGMCHAFGLDPSQVILEKLEINEKKYPVDEADMGSL